MPSALRRTAATMSEGSTASPRANDPILGLPVKARPLRIALFILTVLSAFAALFLQPALAGAVARGALSPIWLFTAIGIYGVFFLAYAGDRFLLVSRRRYPAGKAFFQVALGLLFGLVLLPSTISDYGARPAHGVDRLLSHPDPEIRLVAVEALGFRGPTKEHAEALLAKQKDRDPRVAQTARQVLARWSGRSPDDAAGISAWASALSDTSTATGREGIR
jgi:hypothetical protein